MKNKQNLYLFFIAVFLMGMSGLRNTNADDVCAPGLIPPGNAAEVCREVCSRANPVEAFNGQWNNDSKQCHWFWYGQYGDCGCTPLPCQCRQDGSQESCDESLTKTGAGTCSSDCNCASGRSCVNGRCQKTVPPPISCTDCEKRALTCSYNCDFPQNPDTSSCQTSCSLEELECKKDCTR